MRFSNETTLSGSQLTISPQQHKKGNHRLAHSHRNKIKRPAVFSKVVLIGVIGFLSFAAFAQDQSQLRKPAQVRLGFKLFKDSRFSSPQGDLHNSCSSCHLYNEDPQGMRAQTDFFSRSWVPWRSEDPRRDELRNSPTILDAAMMPRLHFDGEFGSLEDLVKGTLSGRPMGWLPREKERAFEHVRATILKNADGETGYRAAFKQAFGDELETLTTSELVERVVSAVSAYMSTLKTTRTTAYDRFVEANKLDQASRPGEHSDAFGRRLLGEVVALERNHRLRLTRAFDSSALQGMKTRLPCSPISRFTTWGSARASTIA